MMMEEANMMISGVTRLNHPGEISDSSASITHQQYRNFPWTHSSRMVAGPGGGANVRQLFEKELTPSDVSKLNRLVIPKKHALKYFPRIPDSKGGEVEDLELVFYDRWMRTSWKVRYCYWKSSQSFVFTRGWNRFAKEKGLKARDRVIFSSYESGDHQKMFIIDVGYCRLEYHDCRSREQKMMGLESEQYANEDAKENVVPNEDAKENVDPSSTVDSGAKGFRLFGFQII